MIIDQFNVTGVSFDKAKDYPPVGSNRDSIEPVPVPFQGMHPEAGQIHIARSSRTVEHRKDIFNLFADVSPNTLELPILKQPFQPFVLKIGDHGVTLLRQLTIVNCLLITGASTSLPGPRLNNGRI